LQLFTSPGYIVDTGRLYLAQKQKMKYFICALLVAGIAQGVTAQNLDSLFKAHDIEFAFAEKVYAGDVSAKNLYLRADRFARIHYSDDTGARIERDPSRNRITIYASVPYMQSFDDPTHKSVSGSISYQLTIVCVKGAFEYKYASFQHRPAQAKATAFGLLTDEENCPYAELKGSQEWKNKVWEELKTFAFEWANPHSGELKVVMFTVNPNESLSE
jgi:hypothetical protein